MTYRSFLAFLFFPFCSRFPLCAASGSEKSSGAGVARFRPHVSSERKRYPSYLNHRILVLCFALVACWSIKPLFGEQPPSDKSELRFGQLPFVFEPNRGQGPADVAFLARGTYSIFLQADRALFVLPTVADGGKQEPKNQSSVLTLQLLQSNREARAEGLDLLPGKSNYYIGRQSASWKTGIPQYGTVAFKSIYPGIDLMYYGQQGQLEYDFVLSPGADPRAVRFRVTGARRVDLNASGDLLLEVADGAVEIHKPTIYQKAGDGTRRVVAGNFSLRGDEVDLRVGNYDNRRELIIDPSLSYSTLIGANNNTQVQGVAADSNGNVYVTGTTSATNYPTVNAFQTANNGATDVFITKLGPTGDVILYSTYLGGSGSDNAAAIGVDGSGSAYVTGTVGASDFPTTPGAFMTTCPSLCNTPFVTKFLSDGSMAFSTFMGGSNSPAHAIAVNSSGEAYIAGDTMSNDLPTTPGSFEPIYPGMQCSGCYNGYVEKLNALGTALVYSTYFGAAVGPAGVPSTAGSGIAVDSAGSAYLVGNTTGVPLQNPIQSSAVGGFGIPNAFITKFSPDGASLVFSTYFGGGYDYATGVAVDPLGNVHVTGTSGSCEFPLSLNALSTECGYGSRVFVVTLNFAGSHVLFSTFLQSGTASGITVDKAGHSYVTGITTSNGFPVLHPIESTSQQAESNSFVTELDLSGKLLFSTYLGASSPGAPGIGSQAAGIAVDSKGGIYVAGAGQGDFPLLHPIPSQVIQNTYYTLFVAKVSPKSVPQFSLSPRVSPVLALRNVSSVPLTISAITPSTNFTQGGTCGSTLAPGTGCTLILEGAADNKNTGTVTITSNAYSQPQEFTIYKSPTGDSVGSIFSIFPTYVQFPTQLIGTKSAVKRVVIQNFGLQAAAINSITMIQPSVFTQTNNCPALLNPASSCTISITYHAATVQDSAQLAIIHDPSQTRDTVFLSGFGSGSAIAVSTSSVQFGSQFVGAAPLGRIVNFTNTTPYPASITGVSTSTGFAQTNTCTVPLAPRASCRASVTYLPLTNENATGTVTAAGFGPGGAQSVALNATGLILSDLAVSPMPLNLYADVNEPPASGVVTLTNTGSSSLGIQGFQVSGPFSQTNNCPSSLGPTASCNLTVKFSSTQSGVFNGNVSIANSGPNSPQVVPVIGTAQTVLVVSPTVLDFGQQDIQTSGLSYLVLSNSRNYGPITVSSITVQGTDFKLAKNGCPTVLPPLYGCGLVQISFTPSATGVRTGTVTVVATDSPSPHISNLQGTGISNGKGTVSPTTLNFAPQAVGTSSQPKVLTLTNSGTGTLALNGISVSPIFFTQTNTCGSSLAAGAKCTISVSFTPTLKGMVVGSLSVQDDGAGSPHTLTLSGIGK